MKIKLTYFFILCTFSVFAKIQLEQDSIIITPEKSIVRVGKFISTLEDTSNTLTLEDVVNSKNFTLSKEDIPNFGMTKSAYWAKFKVHNATNTEDFTLEFEKITAEELSLYYKINKNDSLYYSQHAGNKSKKYSGRLFIFDFKVPPGSTTELYVKFKSNWGTTFPIKVSTRDKMLHKIFNEELIKGGYIGILFIMVFYNLFIYFSIRDKSYILYVIYIFSFLLFQFNELGYAYKYLWYQQPELYDIALKILPNITCITAIFFVRDFLQTKVHTPKMDKLYNYIIAILVFSFLIPFIKNSNEFSFKFINITTLFTSLYTLALAIIILNKGFKPAKYFLIAWCVLLFSIIQFNLSNLGIIPYFPITDNSLEIGSLIEVFLLSLGLAYRINELKREKELSQEKTINLIEEKKDIIENQNLILERLVKERTKKLESRNKMISEKNEEKSIMMREIHHRVKNNLQMINSMVRLQSRYLNKENTSDSLKEVERRIHTMALLHEKMYQSDNLISINIKEYVSNVINDLLDIYNNEKKVKYSLSIENIGFKTETILYLGLLINELITNSLKHAFNKQENGFLHISITKKNVNQYILQVTNNGSKINFDKLHNSESLGQRLINNFVKQLNGTLNIESNSDITSFTITFSED